MLITVQKSKEVGRCHDCRSNHENVIIVELENIVTRLCPDCAKTLREKLFYTIPRSVNGTTKPK